MKRVITTSILTLGVSTATMAQSPNFALFIADDCSYFDIGCYGSENSITPNIDSFAKEGMLFTQAFQAASMSSPTRHNLFTGIWPVNSGAYPIVSKFTFRQCFSHLYT